MSIASLVAGALAGTALLLAGLGPVTAHDDAPAAQAAADPLVVWAVGDMCDNDHDVPGCGDVADLVAADATTTYFAALGDLQYEKGTLPLFQKYYGPKVGAKLDPITTPIPGNHEYSPTAEGYYTYFGERAGDPAEGYYSIVSDGWRLIYLNSNCKKIADGCGYRGVQARWLDQQLQEPEVCEAIFTHHPPLSDNRTSSGTSNMKYFFRHAFENRAELFVSGHHHSYQRFSPRNATYAPADDGVLPIVSGAGGKSFSAFGTKRSEYRRNTEHGAVRLSLLPTDFSGAFLSIDGTVMDSFFGTCRS